MYCVFEKKSTKNYRHIHSSLISGMFCIFYVPVIELTCQFQVPWVIPSNRDLCYPVGPDTDTASSWLISTSWFKINIIYFQSYIPKKKCFHLVGTYLNDLTWVFSFTVGFWPLLCTTLQKTVCGCCGINVENDDFCSR